MSRLEPLRAKAGMLAVTITAATLLRRIASVDLEAQAPEQGAQRLRRER